MRKAYERAEEEYPKPVAVTDELLNFVHNKLSMLVLTASIRSRMSPS